MRLAFMQSFCCFWKITVPRKENSFKNSFFLKDCMQAYLKSCRIRCDVRICKLFVTHGKRGKVVTRCGHSERKDVLLYVIYLTCVCICNPGVSGHGLHKVSKVTDIVGGSLLPIISDLAVWFFAESVEREEEVLQNKEEEKESADMQVENSSSRAEGSLHFVVQNFSKIKETVLSDPVLIRNLQW